MFYSDDRKNRKGKIKNLFSDQLQNRCNIKVKNKYSALEGLTEEKERNLDEVKDKKDRSNKDQQNFEKGKVEGTSIRNSLDNNVDATIITNNYKQDKDKKCTKYVGVMLTGILALSSFSGLSNLPQTFDCKISFCKDINYINKSLRLQVKNFLKENLPKCRNDQTNEALFQLFQGLSFFNDHYRFGGILDYCIETELIKSTIKASKIFEFNENQELLSNAQSYVECAEAIYSTYIHMENYEIQNNGIL
uniref:Exported protein n=1 Tax=Meloidogyne hapla TaxID=6305 RepID=A0A1I8BPP0_MELHA